KHCGESPLPSDALVSSFSICSNKRLPQCAENHQRARKRRRIQPPRFFSSNKAILRQGELSGVFWKRCSDHRLNFLRIPAANSSLVRPWFASLWISSGKAVFSQAQRRSD